MPITSRKSRSLLAYCRKAIRRGDVSQKTWEALIKRGHEAIDMPDKWFLIFTLVQIALVDKRMVKVLRSIILRRYEDKALAHDPDAIESLWNYTMMANDRKLLHRFSIFDHSGRMDVVQLVSYLDIKTLMRFLKFHPRDKVSKRTK